MAHPSPGSDTPDNRSGTVTLGLRNSTTPGDLPWRREIKRISAALAIDLNARDEGAVEEFLQPDQRRQRHCGPVTEPFGTDWISAVYEALCAAARDEPWDGSALDRVFEAYRASEYGFRRAFEDSHRFYRLNRLLRPSIQKLIYEVQAMAHGRRGTWA